MAEFQRPEYPARKAAMEFAVATSPVRTKEAIIDAASAYYAFLTGGVEAVFWTDEKGQRRAWPSTELPD